VINAHTEIQIIRQPDGIPAFAVIPWGDYLDLVDDRAEPAIKPQHDEWVPNEVVGYMVKDRLSPAAAWRKHLRLTQAEVAARIGISQAAYAQQEKAAKPRKPTREKIARALGIAPALLDLD